MDGKAVYFVGAGLPKALQQDSFPVPLMWDFVKTAAFYAATDDVLLTALTQLEVAEVFDHATSESIALAESITPPKTSTRNSETTSCESFQRDRRRTSRRFSSALRTWRDRAVSQKVAEHGADC